MISEEDEHLLRFLDAVSRQLACLLDLDGSAKASARCALVHTKREHAANCNPETGKHQKVTAAKKRSSQLAKVNSTSPGDKLSRPAARQSALRASKSNRQQPSRATKQRRNKQGARSAVGSHPDLSAKISGASDGVLGQTLLQCPHEDGLVKPLADQQQHHHHHHNQLRLADPQTDQFGDNHKLFGSLQPQHNPLEAHPIAATSLDGHLTLSICDELTLGGGSLSPSATHLSPIDPAISSHFESAHGYYRSGHPDDSSAMHAHHQSQQQQHQSLGSYHDDFGGPPATSNSSANNGGANHTATGAGNAHPSMSSSQQHEAPAAVQMHLVGQQHLQHNAMAIILSGQPDESALNPSSLVECYPSQIQQQQQQPQHLHHQQQQQQHHNHHHHHHQQQQQQQHQSDLQHGQQQHHPGALVDHANHNHHHHHLHHPTYHPLEQTEASQWLPCLANGDQHNLVSNDGSNCQLDQVMSPTTNGASSQLGAGDQVQSAFGVPVYHHSYYATASGDQQQQQHNHQHQHHQHHLNHNHHHQQQSEQLDSFHQLNDDYSGAPLAGAEHLAIHHSQHRQGQQGLGQSNANSSQESDQSQANDGANNPNGAANNSNSNANFEHQHIQQQQQRQHLQLHSSPAYLESAGQHHLGQQQQQHNGQHHHHYHLAVGHHDHHHHQLHHNQHHGIPLVGGIESSSIILHDINLASATWSSPEDLYSI